MVAKKTTGPSQEWWDKAYVSNPNIHVEYELQFKKDLIVPGTKIKIKNSRDTYKFRCLAHNIVLDKTWIDCMDVMTGGWHSFRVEKLKAVVKPKRSYKKRKSEAV